MLLPTRWRIHGLVPAILTTAIILAAQLGIYWSAQHFGSYGMTVEPVPGVPYRVEPLLPAAIAAVLGVDLVLYADLGIAQAAVAMTCLVALQLLCRYAVALAIAAYIPVGLSSVEQYAAALVSFQGTTDGLCCLLVLAICAKAFRSISVWLLVLTCWGATTILFMWGRWDAVVATIYPYFAPIATLVGFAVIGLQFGRGRVAR